MSIVARVFVVFNFILSIVFLVLVMNVWVAPTKWQKMYEKEKIANVEALAKAQERQVALSQSTVSWERKYNHMEAENRNLLIDRERARDELAESRANIIKKENERDSKDAALEESKRRESLLRDRLEERMKVVLKINQALQVAQQNEVNARNERAEMENELNVVKTQLDAISRDKRFVEEELAIQNSRIEGLYLRGVDVAKILNEDPQAVQPDLPGAVVVAVRPDMNLVVISKGTKHGVRPGFYFTIKREDKFVALCRVEKVLDNMCSAQIMPDRSAKNMEVKVNDEALSRP